MRPRWIYAGIFTWMSVSAGRFTAPFLQKVAGFDDFEVGLALAIQLALISILSTPAGSFADFLESKISMGRVVVIIIGLSISSIAVFLHAINYEGDYTLLWYLLLRVIYSCGVALINPTMDGLTLAHLNREGSSQKEYGKERLHGAVWWAIGNILLGISLDLYGFQAVYFWTFIAFSGSTIVLAFYAKIHSYMSINEHMSPERSIRYGTISNMDESNNSIDVETIDTDENDSFMSHHSNTSESNLFTIIFGSVFGAAFLISCTTLFTGFSVIESLVFLFFESLGATWSMCGISVLFTVIYEFPIFHYAPELLKKFEISTLQQIACAAYVIRAIGYGFIPSEHPFRILYLEQLHGITYGCYRIASVEYVTRNTPNGYEASGQGILVSTTGIGSFLGLLVGGFLEGKFGATFMYRVMSTIVAFGMAVLFCADKYTKNILKIQRAQQIGRCNQ